jgi:hypothetical protein
MKIALHKVLKKMIAHSLDVPSLSFDKLKVNWLRINLQVTPYSPRISDDKLLDARKRWAKLLFM